MFTGRFIGHEHGVMGLIATLAVMPVILLTGAAVDLARANLVKSHSGHALAAARPAVQSLGSRRSDLDAVLLKRFYANNPANEMGAPLSLSARIDGRTIRLWARAEVETTFLKPVNRDRIVVLSEVQFAAGR